METLTQSGTRESRKIRPAKPACPDRKLAWLPLEFRAMDRVRFYGDKTVWRVDRWVLRGAVLRKDDDGSHQHLREWSELRNATAV